MENMPGKVETINENLRITLDNNSEFFSPGNIITGYVFYNVQGDDEQIFGFQILFTGRASVNWTTENNYSTGRNIFKRHFPHSNQKIYFKDVTSLLHGSQYLQHGVHQFPFDFEIPYGIPTTFHEEQGHGTIEYYVEARIKIPELEGQGFLKRNLTARVEIPVWYRTDLNDIPKTLAPVTLANESALWCWCCKSRPIGFKVSLKKSGFLVGEPIEYSAELFNGSSREIKGIEVSIIQDVTLRATDGVLNHFSQKISGPELLITIDHTLPPKSQENIQGSLDIIPQNFRPQNLKGCSFIKVFYLLEVKMIIPKSADIVANAAIFIGGGNDGISGGNEGSGKVVGSVPTGLGGGMEGESDPNPDSDEFLLKGGFFT